MTNEVNQSTASPMEGSPTPEAPRREGDHSFNSPAAFLTGLRFSIHPTIRRGTKRHYSEDTPSNVKGWKSKFFGEGFDFCKQQFRCHHPDLAINLENMGLDLDLLDEEDPAKGGVMERRTKAMTTPFLLKNCALDNGDIHNGNQGALSYRNELALLTMATSTTAIKAPYHIIMNERS
ncbi:hypothetical protein Acr_12g0000660 [Actinidia rufa]|uniref:Uncharacterized protein n=1 Tax=Actinidia rufa TaxID=165716 RepID=A0A7J0FFU2_9ERIC|nr:hypothetical protein Acr_12g0000660 [Actinidia rufa]